jgi:ankyrin repeat protein
MDNYRHALVAAASEGHADIVELVLRIPQLDPNDFTAEDPSPIREAATNGHAHVLRALLETRRVDVDWVDDYSATPLFHATDQGHVEAVRVLLEFDADPFLGDIDDQTPVQVAAREGQLEIMRAFIDKKPACATHRNFDSWTPLMHAAEAGHVDMVKLLLASGGNEHSQDQESAADAGTPLFWAAYAGRVDVVDVLLENGAVVDVNTPDATQRTPLIVAASCGRKHVVQKLLDAGAHVDSVNSAGMSALALAIKSGDQQTALVLIKAGADPNLQDHGPDNRMASRSRTAGNSPLSRAAAAGFGMLVRAMMVYESTNPNLCDEKHASPLVCAIAQRQAGVVGMLLASPKVDVNVVDHELGHPLFVAIESKEAAIFSMLLAVEGIDMTVTDSKGRTVWWAAFETSDRHILAAMKRSNKFQSHERFAASLMV